MKSKTFMLVITLLLATSVSFAEEKIRIEDTYGTWVNSDYNEKYGWAKEIFHPDGTSEWYSKITDKKPSLTFSYTLSDSWYDNEGNFWIRYTFYTFEEDGYSGYKILKFSDSGKVRESVWSGVKYPDEMSPIGGNYAIHYRQ